MVQTGRAVVVDTDPNQDSSVEKLPVSEQLPENEPFTLLYMRAVRQTEDIPVVPEIKPNGKWHFINWWNWQRRPGSKVKYSGFKFYDKETQTAGESIDADVMYNGSLPPRTLEEKRARQRATKTPS